MGAAFDSSFAGTIETALSMTLAPALLSTLFIALAVSVALRRRGAGWRGLLVVAALHPLLFLALFVTLGVHLHSSLGGWPDQIGFHGFPDELRVHANIAMAVFASMLVGLFVVVPASCAVCGLVTRLRPGFRALGIYAACSVAAFCATFLAPGPFLYWWWD
jgi:hypothetical protein